MTDLKECVATSSALNITVACTSAAVKVLNQTKGIIPRLARVFVCVCVCVHPRICVHENANCSLRTGGAGAVTGRQRPRGREKTADSKTAASEGDQRWSSGSRWEMKESDAARNVSRKVRSFYSYEFNDVMNPRNTQELLTKSILNTVGISIKCIPANKDLLMIHFDELDKHTPSICAILSH